MKVIKIKNILITCSGKRVSLVSAFKKELNSFSPKSKVFTADKNTSLSPSCFVSDGSFVLPALDNPNYVEALLDVCTTNDIGLIIPTIDTELLLLSEQKSNLLSKNIIPLISSIDFIKKCRDKRKIHLFFNKRGIKTAKEFSRNNYQIPLFIKPIAGSRSENNHIILNESDLKDEYFNDDDLMFLEYFDKKNYQEYTCDLYYDKRHYLKCVVPRKRIEVRDGEVNKGKTEKNILVDYIYKKLGFIDGAMGCLTVQFFKNKKSNEIVGIEINPRFGGGFPLSYESGANFPKWIIEEYFLNKSIETYTEWTNNLLMLRFHEGIYVKNSNA